MVASTGCRSVRNLTGLNGSMRPLPQSGRLFIHASCCLSRRMARRVNGMIMRYTSRSPADSAIVLGNLRHDVVGGEPRVGRARDEKPHVELRRHLMRRRGGHDRRRIARMQAIAARMADRAVDADALEADPHLREADRHLVAVLRRACRAMRSRQARADIPGNSRRQHQPDPVRNTVGFFRADRSKQEVIFVGRKEWRRLGAEEMCVREQAARRGPASATTRAEWARGA